MDDKPLCMTLQDEEMAQLKDMGDIAELDPVDVTMTQQSFEEADTYGELS